MTIRQSSCLLTLAIAVATSGCFDDPNGKQTAVGADAGREFPPGERGSGAILLLDASFEQYPELGSGVLLVPGPVFPKDGGNQPVYEVAEGSPFACKVWELTPEQYLDPGIDIGTLEFTIDKGGLVMPPCAQTDGEWRCNGAAGSGGDIAVVDSTEGIFSITNTGMEFGADEVGRLITISGAADPANNGTFVVVGTDGDHTVHFKNPDAVAETDTPGAYTTVAGRGPGGLPDAFPDDARVTFKLTATDEDERFEDFEELLNVGDQFTLDTASQPLLTNIPMTGEAFEMACNGEGGDCGAALATAVDMQTTDADIDPDAPLGEKTGLPNPVNKSVHISCVFLTGRVEVPEEVSAYLANSGATRVRTIFVRAENTEVVKPGYSIVLVTGHAQGGFTDIPPI